MKFLQHNGLSVFSLAIIIGVIVWVSVRAPLAGAPAASPRTAPVTSPLGGSLQDQLMATARSLGLDTEAFSACVSARKYQKLVEDSTEEGKQLGIQGTPSSVIDGTLLVGALPMSEFSKAIAGAEKGSLEPDVDGFPSLGKANAPTLIVEYGDYRCGYCARYHAEILPELQKQYIDTGAARFVFKDMVIFGDASQRIAEAAHCAADQGKFWEFHAAGFTLTSAD